jgi:hypothetical protein
MANELHGLSSWHGVIHTLFLQACDGGHWELEVHPISTGASTNERCAPFKNSTVELLFRAYVLDYSVHLLSQCSQVCMYKP